MLTWPQVWPSRAFSLRRHSVCPHGVLRGQGTSSCMPRPGLRHRSNSTAQKETGKLCRAWNRSPEFTFSSEKGRAEPCVQKATAFVGNLNTIIGMFQRHRPTGSVSSKAQANPGGGSQVARVVRVLYLFAPFELYWVGGEVSPEGSEEKLARGH